MKHSLFFFFNGFDFSLLSQGREGEQGLMSILAFLGKQTNKAAVRRKFILLSSSVVGGEHVESSGQFLSAPPLARVSELLLARCGSSVPS